MAQAAELTAVLDNFSENAPAEAKAAIMTAKADFISSFDVSKAIKPGATLPSFTLKNALGKPTSSSTLLSKGPLLITFYRGSWCPFCNIALHHMQAHLEQYHAKGVELVAITPELPDTTLSTTEKEELKFQVLSDEGNAFARKLGIVWKQPDELRPVFEKFGNDLKGRNGDDSFEVPVPATLLVGKDGAVRNVWVDPDYTKRIDPGETLRWIDAL
ncbi:MAG: hypothetical protein MMC23_008051 [Stictis urceolatum]|nr:hypothetical protein [Stictis urceolata]